MPINTRLSTGKICVQMLASEQLIHSQEGILPSCCLRCAKSNELAAFPTLSVGVHHCHRDAFTNIIFNGKPRPICINSQPDEVPVTRYSKATPVLSCAWGLSLYDRQTDAERAQVMDGLFSATNNSDDAAELERVATRWCVVKTSRGSSGDG